MQIFRNLVVEIEELPEPECCFFYEYLVGNKLRYFILPNEIWSLLYLEAMPGAVGNCVFLLICNRRRGPDGCLPHLGKTVQERGHGPS